VQCGPIEPKFWVGHDISGPPPYSAPINSHCFILTHVILGIHTSTVHHAQSPNRTADTLRIRIRIFCRSLYSCTTAKWEKPEFKTSVKMPAAMGQFHSCL